jgi:hypothetical protein
MADAAAKVNFFFEAAGATTPQGWTETFWTSVAASQNQLQNIVNNYVSQRCALLGQGASLQFARITNVPANRISFIQYMTGKQGLANLFTNPPGDDYDLSSLDLLVRMQDNVGKRRQFWMGGLPDSQTDTGQQNGILGAFVNSPAWKQWLQAIGNCGFGIRSIQAKGPPTTYMFNLIQLPLVQPIMTRKRSRGRPFDLFRGRRLA